MRASGEEIPGRPRDDQAGTSDPVLSEADDTQARPTEEAREARPVDTREAPAVREQPAPPRPRAGRRPKWPIPLALLGLAALVAAGVLAWGVAPGRKQLPENLTFTRDVTGTANALLRPAALEAGDFGNALVTDVPVTGQRTVRVVATSGDAARVQEDRVLLVDGQPVGTGSDTYAVDRRSLEPPATVPGDWDVQAHQGLTVAFPVDAERRDYTVWVSDLQTTAPLRFVREESREGVTTFVYEAEIATGTIQDPAVLADLPSSLSRSALPDLAPALGMPAEQQALLARAAPGLPEQLPISYTFEGAATYWVEPETGIIVDMQQQVVRTGTVAGPGGAVLATVPVYNVDTRFDDASVAAAAREATDRRAMFTRLGSTWPWVLGVLGIVALVVSLLGLLIRRRPPRQEAPPPSYRPTERTTRVDIDGTRSVGRTQPQPPYVGQTPHTGPYRKSGAGQGQPSEGQPRRARRPGPGRVPPGTPEP